MPAKKTTSKEQPTRTQQEPLPIVSVSLDLAAVPSRTSLVSPTDAESAQSYDLTRATLASFVRQLKPGTISKADLEATILLSIAENSESERAGAPAATVQSIKLLSEVAMPKNDGLSTLGSALARAVDRMGKRRSAAERDDD